jgi:hypothetical protein
MFFAERVREWGEVEEVLRCGSEGIPSKDSSTRHASIFSMAPQCDRVFAPSELLIPALLLNQSEDISCQSS